MSKVLISSTTNGVRTIALDRPSVMNALDDALRAELVVSLDDSEHDPAVHVVVLTGSDPAFCAGLDLREAGRVDRDPLAAANPWRTLMGMNTPVIGAINGVAITGGLELALGCSFLIASERARFADTHARIGVHPGGGLTGLLPQAIGIRRARQLSFTGDFIDADTALRWGLVNAVVPHEELMVVAGTVAEAVAGNDTAMVHQLNDTYRCVTSGTLDEGLREERRRFERSGISAAEVARRRDKVMARGRAQ